MRSPGAVGVVPLRFDAEGNPMVVLVRQYRPALGRRAASRSRPACATSRARTRRATARRELAEECGLAAGRLELLTAFQNAAGMTDAATHVYLALDLDRGAEPPPTVPRRTHMTRPRRAAGRRRWPRSRRAASPTPRR